MNTPATRPGAADRADRAPACGVGSTAALKITRRRGPALASYDHIVINSSAGKDSQAALSRVIYLLDRAGISRSSVVVVHADLGRVEWPGTRQLAEDHARAYGVRFEVVRRERGDLLTQVEQRGMWPSSAARFCTSDQKTSQVTKLMTRLVGEHRALQSQRFPGRHLRVVRILNVLGIRAQESPARAKRVAFGPDRASNGKRRVDRWLPIFDWSTQQVWAEIARSGLPYHPAYDTGMPRLSCVFCIFARDQDLMLAARLNPGLAAEYIAVESRIGHTFTANRSIASIVAEAGPPVHPRGSTPSLLTPADGSPFRSAIRMGAVA